MLSLRDKFSDQDLVVEISGPGVVDLDIVDLPGVPDSQQPHYRSTVSIIRRIVRDPNVLIVTLVNGATTDAAIHPFGTVFNPIFEGIRPNWESEAIVIKNFVNTALSSINSVEGVGNYFRSQRNAVHVMLVPDAGRPGSVNVDKMTPEMFRTYLNGSVELEAVVFHDLLDEIERRDSRDSHGVVKKVDKCIRSLSCIKFGVGEVRLTLQAKLRTAFTERASEIAEVLKAKIEAIGDDIHSMEGLKSLNQPRNMRRLWKKFFDDFVALYKVTLSAKQKHFPVGDGDIVTFSPTEYARAFEDEFTGTSTSHDRNSPVESSEAAASIGGNQHLNHHGGLGQESATSSRESAPFNYSYMVHEMSKAGGKYRSSLKLLDSVRDRKMIGYGSLFRVLVAWGFMLLREPLKKTPPDAIFSAGIAPNDRISGVLDMKQMVMTVLNDNFGTTFSSYIRWLCKHVENLLLYPLDIIEPFLLKKLPEYKPLENHKKFRRLFRGQFESFFRNQTKASEAAFKRELEETTGSVSITAIFGTLSLYQQLLVKQDARLLPGFASTSTSSSSSSTGNSRRQELSDLETPPSSTSPDGRFTDAFEPTTTTGASADYITSTDDGDNSRPPSVPTNPIRKRRPSTATTSTTTSFDSSREEEESDSNRSATDTSRGTGTQRAASTSTSFSTSTTASSGRVDNNSMKPVTPGGTRTDTHTSHKPTTVPTADSATTSLPAAAAGSARISLDVLPDSRSQSSSNNGAANNNVDGRGGDGRSADSYTSNNDKDDSEEDEGLSWDIAKIVVGDGFDLLHDQRLGNFDPESVYNVARFISLIFREQFLRVVEGQLQTKFNNIAEYILDEFADRLEDQISSMSDDDVLSYSGVNPQKIQLLSESIRTQQVLKASLEDALNDLKDFQFEHSIV
jgi:hypothetical protein